MSDPYAQRRIRALAWEARRQGVSYGILCSRLRPGDEEEILRRYDQAMGSTSRGGPERTRRTKWDWTPARQMYDRGCTDREISEVIGCPKPSVGTWRLRHKLPPNRKKKGGA